MSGRVNKTGWVALVAAVMAVMLLGRAASANPSLVAHEATYKIKISLLGGTLRTVVAESKNGFTATSVISPTGFANILLNGSIEESATFSVGSNGLRPEVYRSADTLSKTDKFMDFTFDWDENAVTANINDEPYVFALDGSVRDRVSIQYELMYNLANNISNSHYVLLDGDRLKQIQITTIGKKTIKTPFGSFEAVGIQHQAKDSTRISTLWCAEELGFLPVLIEQHRKGKRRVRAILTSYVPSRELASEQSDN